MRAVTRQDTGGSDPRGLACIDIGEHPAERVPVKRDNARWFHVDKVCMECAVQVATHPGGARCPQCREVFETVTWCDERYAVNVATNTMYHYRAGNNQLVPYLVMSEVEMKVASRIFANNHPGENGILAMHFYVPQFLYDIHPNPTWVIILSDADEGPIGRVTTRRDSAITYWYDRDVYRQQVQDGQVVLHSMFDFPLMFMKAQVSKAFMSMLEIGKFHSQRFPQQIDDDPLGGLLVLSTEFPAGHVGHELFAQQ